MLNFKNLVFVSHRRNTVRAALLATGASLVAIATPSFAQDALEPKEESSASQPAVGDAIVVTARRRDENVQDVPMSISAFGSQQLDQLGVVDTKDIARVSPGVFWKGGGATSRNNVFIRGVGNQNVAYSSAPAVAIYIDDTYLNAQSLQGFAAFDLDRVEVLKGPQGTLYGRNTTGGAIKFITRSPRVGEPLTADLEVGVGNFGLVRLEGGVGGPIGDNAALRISGISIDRGGMYEDYISGEQVVDRNVKAVRAQLAIEPTDRLSISLMGTYGRSRSDNVRYKRIDYIDPSTIDFDAFGNPFYTGTCATPTIGTATGCSNLAVEFGMDVPELNGDIYDVQSNLARGEVPERNEAYGGSLSLDYDFGPSTLTSVTSYFKNEVLDTSDVDASAANLLVIQDTAEPEQFSQEIRLASNGDPDFRYVVGGFYFHEKLFATAPVSITAFGFGFGSAYSQTTESLAAFAEGSYRVTPEIDLTLGVRYSNDRKKMDFDFYGFVPDGREVIGYADLISDPALGFGNFFSSNGVRDKSDSVSGRISLSYTPTDDLLLYASINRGFKGAEFNVGADNLLTANFVDPETVDAYEIGLKSALLDGVITFNLAGYYYDYKDKQETLFDGGVARLASAQARVWGLDGDVAIRPAYGLTLSGNFSLLDAKYRDFENCAPGGVDCSGNRLPNAPKLSAQFLASYEFDIGDRTFSVQGDASYRDTIEFSPINLSYLRQPSYWLFGARATAELTESLELAAWIKNIDNKRYLADAFDVSAVGYSLGLPGEPRTYGLTLSARF